MKHKPCICCGEPADSINQDLCNWCYMTDEQRKVRSMWGWAIVGVVAFIAYDIFLFFL
jgi:predicted nucleic acid-binding Zn ribbon protein